MDNIDGRGHGIEDALHTETGLPMLAGSVSCWSPDALSLCTHISIGFAQPQLVIFGSRSGAVLLVMDIDGYIIEAKWSSDACVLAVLTVNCIHTLAFADPLGQ